VGNVDDNIVSSCRLHTSEFWNTTAGRRHTCVVLLGGSRHPMTSRLATHPSTTTVKIIIQLHHSIWYDMVQCCKYQCYNRLCAMAYLVKKFSISTSVSVNRDHSCSIWTNKIKLCMSGIGRVRCFMPAQYVWAYKPALKSSTMDDRGKLTYSRLRPLYRRGLNSPSFFEFSITVSVKIPWGCPFRPSSVWRSGWQSRVPSSGCLRRVSVESWPLRAASPNARGQHDRPI